MKYRFFRFAPEKVHYFDQENRGLVYSEPLPKKHKEILSELIPGVNPENLVMACFPGFGGGCDPVLTELKKAGLAVSGDGRSYLEESSLEFIDLK